MKGNQTGFDLTKSLGPTTRYAYLRGRFQKGSALRLAARQNAMVWLNGVYIGRTFERTHTEELRWRTFDLTPHLRSGENVIAVLAHHWGGADEVIPGVPPPGRFLVTVEGVDAVWHATPAVEFRPARRHNSLIGHEELRDLRLEPVGWREPGFDDSAWMPLSPCNLPDIECLPSPLRPLREELIFPVRILQQGRLRRGLFAVCEHPANRAEWQMMLELPVAQTLNFLLEIAVGDRLWVDDKELPLPVEPPFDWVRPIQPMPLQLSAGRHVLRGHCPRALRFGWRGLVPPGGDRTDWGVGKLDPELGPLAYEIGEDGHEQAILYEFPFNCTMLPRLDIVKASAGAKMELVYAERLSGQSGLLLPGAYTDRVILREGAQRWEVSFQYKSAGVMMVVADPSIQLGTVAAIYRRYDHDHVGEWQSNDARLNRIWEISRHTVEMGSQDFIVDGPWREQLLYIGDILVSHQAAYYLFSNAHEITEWAHQQFAQGQRPDGIFSPNQPDRPAPEYDRLLDQVILWPLELEQHRLYTGHEDFVRRLHPNVERLLEGFAVRFAKSDDPRLRELTGWNWVDHPGLEDGKPRSIRHDGIPTAINLLYLMALRTMPQFEALAARLEQRLRREHWNSTRQLFADCVVGGQPSQEVSLHVNLLAIEAGLNDDPDGVLTRAWNQPGVLQISGSYFRYHLLEVLHRLGRHQELLNEIRTWWGSMVDTGLTTLAENQFQNGDWGASVGHPWGATPCIHLVRAIAGLEPLEPGWRRVRCEPHLGDLQHLKVTVPTPFGAIRADFTRDNALVCGRINVPQGVEVVFPRAQDQATISVCQYP